MLDPQNPPAEPDIISENLLLLLMRRHGGTVRISSKEWEAHNGIWEEYTYAVSLIKGSAEGEFILELVKRNEED